MSLLFFIIILKIISPYKHSAQTCHEFPLAFAGVLHLYSQCICTDSFGLYFRWGVICHNVNSRVSLCVLSVLEPVYACFYVGFGAA